MIRLLSSWQTCVCCNKTSLVVTKVCLSCLSHQKYFVMTYFCHDKSVVVVSILLSWQKVCFVATNLCLSQQNYCHDKMILVVVAAPASDRCHAISNSTFQCWPTSACLHSHCFGFLAPIPTPTPHPTNHFSSVSPGFDSWCFFFAGLRRWLWGWRWAERGMSRDIWHFLSVLPFREHSGDAWHFLSALPLREHSGVYE